MAVRNIVTAAFSIYGAEDPQYGIINDSRLKGGRNRRVACRCGVVFFLFRGPGDGQQERRRYETNHKGSASDGNLGILSPIHRKRSRPAARLQVPFLNTHPELPHVVKFSGSRSSRHLLSTLPETNARGLIRLGISSASGTGMTQSERTKCGGGSTPVSSRRCTRCNDQSEEAVRGLP